MKVMLSKLKSKSSALLILLTLTLVLIGCASGSPVERYYSPISQPDYLYLPAKAKVPTAQGLYQPPTAQKWISEAKLLKLERENMDLITAINQLKAEKDYGK